MFSGILERKSIILGVIGVFIAYIYYQNRSNPTPSPTVEISTGKIQGILSKSREGKEFYEYLGIPFAKPPIRELRFEPPEPPISWEEILETKTYGSGCMQVESLFGGSVSGSEDCLFLNVFTPKSVSKGFSETPLPVMVYIHGGYFMSGQSTNFGPSYFMDEDIVFVTLNYRVNSFGFLNTGDGVIKGNMGLKDQTMGLKWVQQNIDKFGGDPSRVTIFGSSAGSMSVNYHMMSQMSTGLFRKAISQSGVVMNTWSAQTEPKKQAEYLIERMNCKKGNSKESVECLKALKAETIAEIHNEAASPFLNKLHMYAPSIENSDTDAFLTESPRRIFSSGSGNNVPWIIGIDGDEGLLYSGRIIHNEKYKSQLAKKFHPTLSTMLEYDEDRTDITEKLKKYYSIDEKTDFVEKFKNYTNLFSDRYYNFGSREAAKLQSKYSRVYLYYNNYDTEWTLGDMLTLPGKLPIIVEILWKIFTNWFQKTVLRTEPIRYGVCHGDHLFLFFPMPFQVTRGSNDYEMSRDIIKLWVQFAYDDTKMKFNGVEWTPVSPESSSPKYMQFSNDVQSNTIIEEPFRERIEFWKSLNVKTKFI